MIPQRDTLGMVTRRYIRLKWQKELPLIQRSLKTLHTSLRQFTTIVWRGSVEWHTRTRIDDVDYLVENNTRDDFSNWGEAQ